MPLGDIVGHRHVIDLLSRAVERGSLPPSLIFAGPEGVGKHRVAVALAQALNCAQPVRADDPAAHEGLREKSDVRPSTDARGALSNVEGRRPKSDVRSSPQRRPRTSDLGRRTLLPYDACGVCPSCRRIERGSFADVIAVGLEDTATIGVEQIREVVMKAAYRPYEGRRRVIIIDPADLMERFAQNALLKVLEETPAPTVFVLLTSRPDVLLQTVRSRCPQIRFGGLDIAELTGILVRECKLPERAARAAAVVASGSVARAVEAASEEVSGARGQALDVLRYAASMRDARRIGEQIKDAIGLERKSSGGKSGAGDRESATLMLRAMESLLRDLVILDVRSPKSEVRSLKSDVRSPAGEGKTLLTSDLGPRTSDGMLANADLIEDLEHLVPSFKRKRAMRAFAAVDEALDALGRNVSAKLVVDWLGFRI